MTIRKLYGLLLTLTMVVAVISCKQDDNYVPDVSQISVDAKVVRFDSILFAIENVDDLEKVFDKYPEYSNLYFNQILRLKQGDRQSLLDQIQELQSFETFLAFERLINNIYGDFTSVVDDYKNAMKYYKYYFDASTTPDLYFTLTEFGLGTFIFPINENKDGIGVSLDMFLGDSIDYSQMARIDPSFSAYRSRTYNQTHLVKKAIDALVSDLIPVDPDPTFINQLIFEGKKKFISKKILPFESDTVIWEYKFDQWQWVQDNEWNIYSHLITNDIFYSTQRTEYARLLQPAPHTVDMPQEAPGQAVIYIGYQIVRSYMNNNPEVTMSELIATPGQDIFNAAKYRPDRN